MGWLYSYTQCYTQCSFWFAESLPPLQVEALRVTSSSLSVIFNFPPEESDVTAVDDVFETSQAVFLYESNVEAYADTAFPKNDGNTRFTFESLQPMINYTVKVIDNESGRSLQASFLTGENLKP